jgi:hypothetical protein
MQEHNHTPNTVSTKDRHKITPTFDYSLIDIDEQSRISPTETLEHISGILQQSNYDTANNCSNKRKLEFPY